MGEKFGSEWLERKEFRPFSNLVDGIAGLESCVLVWHGQPDGPDEKDLAALLRGTRDISVLFVSSGPARKQWAAKLDHKPENVHLLKYGLANIEVARPDAWKQQPRWVLRRFDEFIAATQSQMFGPPPWHLLDPPAAPEHVIACYLCSLVQARPEPSWKLGFEEEANYWKPRTRILLDWDRHQSDQVNLRAFLGEVGGLATDLMDRWDDGTA